MLVSADRRRRVPAAVAVLLVLPGAWAQRPSVRNSNGSVLLQPSPGGHVVANVAGEEINLDQIPMQTSAMVSAAVASLRSTVTSTNQATTASLRQQLEVAVSSSVVESANQFATLSREISNLNPAVAALSRSQESSASTAAAATSQVAAAGQSTARTVGSLTNRLNEALTRLARSEAAVANSSRCALSGQAYNSTSQQCVGPSNARALLGEPDWESEWWPMRSNSGSSTTTFRELRHGLNADCEVVKVVAMYLGSNGMRGHVIEGLGAMTCDDDASNGCNEYGGFVYGYDNNRIRIWLPEQANGPRYGHTFMISDGWGGGMMNIAADGDPGNPVFFKAYVWRQYRRGSRPDFDRTINMRSRHQTAYAEVAHRLGEYPERVYVTAQATSGSNSGFKFPARGSNLADNDGGKEYGGLVFAYNNQNVRLWAPSSSGGRLLAIRDGWGGERYRLSSDPARVQVRAWRSRTAPTWESEWVQMCSQCARWPGCGSSCSRGATDCNWANREMSFKRFVHGLGKLPARVQAMFRPSGSRNNGYIFEAVGGGNDDEHDDRSGSIFAYDNNAVNIYAPTRNNANRWGRICGVSDGWGNGRNNDAYMCAFAKVRVWGE